EVLLLASHFQLRNHLFFFDRKSTRELGGDEGGQGFGLRQIGSFGDLGGEDTARARGRKNRDRHRAGELCVGAGTCRAAGPERGGRQVVVIDADRSDP